MPTIIERTQAAEKTLGEVINKHSQRVKILASKNQKIQFCNSNEKIIYHLISGEVEIHNIENNLIITNVTAPSILGLSTMFTVDEYFYAQMVTDAEFTALPLPLLTTILDEENLWGEVSLILTHYLKIYFSRDVILSNTSVYDIIKIHLELLWEQNDDRLEEISVFEFILNRTPVSRSSLNKILKDLVAGGYIKLNRGKLIYLKTLPNKY